MLIVWDVDIGVGNILSHLYDSSRWEHVLLPLTSKFSKHVDETKMYLLFIPVVHPILFKTIPRSPVPSLPPCSTSSSWQHSRGCSLRGCSSTSCWWRCLRASTHGGGTSTWWAMEFRLSSWPFQPQWTTAATAQIKCEYVRSCLLFYNKCTGEFLWYLH